MKPADLLKEALFPLTDMTVVMAIIGFGSLLWLAAAAGLLGLWLMFIIVPAAFRYAIYLLEARAHGKETLVAGIEIFNIADNFWGIFPMLLLGGFIWLEFTIAFEMSLRMAQILLGVFFLVYPASMAVLGITRSPVDSVNPVLIARMIRTCGVDYVFIPIVLVTVTLAVAWLVANILPDFAVYYLGIYVFFLLFTYTGAVLHANAVTAEVDIEAPAEKTESEITADLEAERQKVANHAYGFISRGNREGGFRHIREWIESDPDTDQAVAWFFNEMMRWETKEPALFFGQECLSHFLHHELDAQALKLMSRCIHEEPRWKPGRDDREHAIELAERYGREDLLKSIR